MGDRRGGCPVVVLLRMMGLWTWCKTLVLLACCVVVWQTEVLGTAEKLVTAGAALLWTAGIVRRALRAQQQVTIENGLLLFRTAWGGERQVPLREVGALTYTARTLTLRGPQGEALCRLDRSRWEMDPLLEELAACGRRSRGPYVVGAAPADKALAALWMGLAAVNCGVWGTLWFLSRREDWEAGALIALALVSLLPLVGAVVHLHIRLTRRLLVEETFLRYVPSWGRKTRDFSWREVYWIAQPGGRAHLLRLSDQKTAAVLSGRDQHLYELLCDLYAHWAEAAERRKAGIE